MKCTTNKYNDLYAKWLKDPTEFINFAKLKPSDKILDLCGGTGQLSLKLLELGFANVTLLDLNPRINNVRTIQCDINKVSLEILGKYDVIFCRQAISYLKLSTINKILSLLNKQGKFIFNNYKKPKNKFLIYNFNDKKFLEIAISLFNKTFHIQYSKNLGIDFSFFSFHSTNKILNCIDKFIGINKNFVNVELKLFPNSNWFKITNNEKI